MSGDTEPQVRVDNKKANRRSTDATFPDLCGPPCEALTKPENILASRSSWCFVPHPGQQQLLNYVLDISRPKDELIVETSSGCITRADFWTLGLNKQMESTTDAQRMDIIVLPLWTPGHFQLCVLKPPKREILFLDPLYTKAGFGGQQYVSLLRNLAVKLIPGQWSEKKSFDLKGFSSQDYGVDCGIFMLMSALYVALDAPFDYTISDMPYLRKWWCLLLMENFDLRSSGKLFAHWREEAKAVLEGQHVPIFRLKKHKFQEVSQKPAVVEDLRPAVQWVVQNKALFRGHVTMPKYLSLNQGDQQRVLRDMSEEEDTGARDLFLFVFQFAEDMELFLKACADEQGLRVSAMFDM
ncbi:unnamed protein product [Oreochromis niloticus]|nr:unnamed protein product [Mustela putorius furo]